MDSELEQLLAELWADIGYLDNGPYEHRTLARDQIMTTARALADYYDRELYDLPSND